MFFLVLSFLVQGVDNSSMVSKATREDSGEGGGGGDCQQCVLVQQPSYAVIYNMRNKKGGLVSGCRKKCGHSCTIKFVQTPKIKY